MFASCAPTHAQGTELEELDWLSSRTQVDCSPRSSKAKQQRSSRRSAEGRATSVEEGAEDDDSEDESLDWESDPLIDCKLRSLLLPPASLVMLLTVPCLTDSMTSAVDCCTFFCAWCFCEAVLFILPELLCFLYVMLL